MSGEQFKLTESMMDEIYLKSKGRIQNFEDTKVNSQKLRKFFGRIEYPNIVNKQLSQNYINPTTDIPEQVRFYESSKGNLDWYRQVSEFVESKGYTQYKVQPLVIQPKQKELAVAKILDKEASFLPRHLMTKQDAPYIKAYYLTKKGRPLKTAPRFEFEEHHTQPLALQEAKAYLINPNPNPMEHVFNYQNQVKINGSKDPYYNQFIAIPKEEHTGKNGIHYNDKLTLQDLQRLKALSRTGRFKTLDDLMYYYDRIKAAQNQYLLKSEGQIQ